MKKLPQQGLWLENIEVPRISENEVLIKVQKTAICGTDLHIFLWDEWSQKHISPPVVLGHEFCGEVVKLGSQVQRFQVGDLVSAEGHHYCGRCFQCRSHLAHLCPNTKSLGIDVNGAYSEYVNVHEKQVMTFDASIPKEIAAIFDPLGNVVHTVSDLEIAGSDVLITGVGPVGLLAVCICRFLKARHIVVTDVNDYRLNLATQLGADIAVNVQNSSLEYAREKLGLSLGFDICLEMSGNPKALQSSIAHCRSGGVISSLGLFSAPVLLDWNEIVLKGIEIKGIYGRRIFSTWNKMFALLKSGLDVRPVITHRFFAQDFLEAFLLMKEGNTGKVILEWS